MTRFINLLVLVAMMEMGGCAALYRSSVNPATVKTLEKTEAWEVEVLNVPSDVKEVTVFIAYRGETWGHPMKSIEGPLNRFRAEVPYNKGVKFMVEFWRGTKMCGGMELKDKAEYCGPIRIFTDRGSPGRLEEQRLEFTAVMVANPEGDRGRVSCGDEQHLVITPPWTPQMCSYSDFTWNAQ